MKYISLLIAVLLIFAACGKKTDPIPKDTLEDVSAPEAYVLRAQLEGFFIANNESAFLLVEKGVPQGEECSTFSELVIIEPKGDYLDTDVTVGQRYSYRLRKQTIKYKIKSGPVVVPVTFSVPPVVEKAEYREESGKVMISVVPSAVFIRMDVYSGGESIMQTGKNDVEVFAADITDQKVRLVLTDQYGNVGDAYPISFAPVKEVMALPAVTGLSAAYIADSLRIVWDNNINDNYTYAVKICDDVSCETYEVYAPYYVFKKEFDKCVDITVNAETPGNRSIDSTLRFCK